MSITRMIARSLGTLCLALGFQTAVSAVEPQHDSGCAVIAERSEDGKLIRVCEVIFPQLWPQDAEELTGQNLQVSGYVAYIDGEPHLFASKDVYVYSGGRGGVWLRLPPAERSRFDRVASRGAPVTVAGRYSAGKAGSKALGTLEVIGRHYWEQESPGELPRLPED